MQTLLGTLHTLRHVMIQRGREKFNEYMKQIGQTLRAGYKGFADRFGFTGNDARSAAAIIPAMITVYWGSQQKFEIEEATVEKARVKCINCAFWNTVQSLKITDDLCSNWSRYSWQGRSKAINPKLAVTLVKARPLGDSICEWAFELQA